MWYQWTDPKGHGRHAPAPVDKISKVFSRNLKKTTFLGCYWHFHCWYNWIHLKRIFHEFLNLLQLYNGQIYHRSFQKTPTAFVNNFYCMCATFKLVNVICKQKFDRFKTFLSLFQCFYIKMVVSQKQGEKPYWAHKGFKCDRFSGVFGSIQFEPHSLDL